MIALLALAFTVKAQQYVSTEPANRNVILEEFTGRNCGYCPDGHLIANGIMANNPGRVWAINVHAGGYAPTTYPNLRCDDGLTIHNGFDTSYGYPSGVINRSTAASQGRGTWANLSNQQLNQAAECNVAGVARINPETRVASITVEVYYTGNSTVTENYLTVAMLQDSIMGSQSGMTSNPAQVVNGTYCHMHILRDVITPSAWGEAISPTTAGTLITKTYEYTIPESIGNPNGVDVILDHVFFLAWVSERFQGTPARPILNACELAKSTITDQPIYPAMGAVAQSVAANCSPEKDFSFTVTNIGTETLTSMKFTATIEEASYEFEWTGELESGSNAKIDFTMGFPYGEYVGTLMITEANGTAYEASTAFVAKNQEAVELVINEETTNIKLFLMQDQWGEQISWELINSAGEVVASHGAYGHLMGSGSTQLNVENINGLAANECYLFRIYDSNSNGICCNYGHGYYYFKDAAGNIFLGGEDNGDYGAEANELFSIRTTIGVNESASNGLMIYPNPANNKIYVDGEGVGVVEVYNSLGQKVTTVEGTEKTAVDVASYENGVYVVRVISNDGVVTTKKVTIAH